MPLGKDGRFCRIDVLLCFVLANNIVLPLFSGSLSARGGLGGEGGSESGTGWPPELEDEVRHYSLHNIVVLLKFPSYPF